MESQVLNGVPRIGYDIHLCPFPGSLYSLLQYIKDPQDYELLMGVTGAAFRRLYNKDDGGNIDLLHLRPEPYKQIFKALHYDYTVVPPKDRDEMIRAVKDSISKGRPLLAFGIIGPPECGLVTGYDEDGDVLIGYSYFQDRSVEGYYKQSDWYENAAWINDLGFVVVGDKKKGAAPSRRDILISSLKWIIDLTRTPKRPEVPDHASGLAAYDAWADGLETDSNYPKDNMTALGWRVMIHGDQCVMQDDRRWGAKYLRLMIDAAPEVSGDLESAASLYDEVAGLVGKTWPWESCEYEDPKVKQSMADHNVRRELAKAVRRSRDKEARAVENLEKALAGLERACFRQAAQ